MSYQNRLLVYFSRSTWFAFHQLLQFITAIEIFPDGEEVGFLLIFHRLSARSVTCRFSFSFKKLLHNLFTLLTLSNLSRTNYKFWGGGGGLSFGPGMFLGFDFPPI